MNSSDSGNHSAGDQNPESITGGIDDGHPTASTKQPRQIKATVRHALPLMRSWIAYATLPLAGLLTAPITARVLGPVGRGQLAGILQPITLAGAVAALGIPSAVTYFVGRGYESKAVRANATKISTIMTVSVALVLFFYSAKVSHQLTIPRFAILLIWCAFLPSAIISIRRSFLQGKRQFSRIDLERTLISTFRVAMIILLWLVGVKYVGAYAVAYMVAGLTASAVLWLPFKKAGDLPHDAKTQKLKRWELLRFALFSSFGTIATAMNSRLDQALMPAVVPAVELGFYSVAVTVAEVPNIITSVSGRNLLAEASARFSRRHILRNWVLGALGLCAVCGGMLIVMPHILPIVFGKDFAPAIVLVKVLLIASMIQYAADTSSAYLAGSGAPEFGSVGPAVGALSTAALFAIYWHHMTAVTAAWISVATQSATAIVGFVLIGVLTMRTPKKNSEGLGAGDTGVA
jgi:O-antigen/teichoic acid export membrane protein